MNEILIYVRRLDSDLGGPLYSTLDLFRLIQSERPVRILVGGTRRRAEESVERYGLSAADVCTSQEYLSGRVPEQHVLHLQHVFYPEPALLANLARRRGVKIVLSPRGALDSWSLARRPYKKAPAIRLLRPLYWERANAIHCTAALEAKQVQEAVPGSLTLVAPNPVSLAWETSGASRINSTVRALFLSRLHEKKRPDLAISGLAPLLKEGLVECLTIGGSGTQEKVDELKAQARREGVTEKVEFVGELTQEQCAQAYDAHELFILPTSQENFGRALFEAVAAGSAVFVPRSIDTWNELHDLGAVEIEQNPVSIERAVRTYLSAGVAQRRSASEVRRLRAKEFLAPDRLRAQYLDLYEQVERL